MTIEIRPYQPGDEFKIVELFKLVFGKTMPLGYWRWRFGNGNPWGSTIVVAMDGETMAAHYAVSHCRLTSTGTDTIPAAQSMTTMTHPEYRGRGLFVECAKRCFEMAKKAGIKIIWSFPNANSAPGFYNKLGWVRLRRIGSHTALRGRVVVGGPGHQAWRWEGGQGPEYGALLLDPAYQQVMESLDLHLEDSDTYTYERDCRRFADE